MREAEFIALSELFARPARREVSDLHAFRDETQAGGDNAMAGNDCSCESRAVRARALREARLFRAQLRDAFDDAVLDLLRELAADVLARELRIAPCDLGAIVRRVAQAGPVVCVRVAGVDVGPIDGFAVVRDDSLAHGDAIVEVVGGSIDARLGVRVADVLEASS